jgi:hypothetical protein
LVVIGRAAGELERCAAARGLAGSSKEHDRMFNVNHYRTERGKRSHLVAFLGALVGGIALACMGFFLGALLLDRISPGNEGALEGIGYFLFTAGIGCVAGAWLGQVAGCGLALRLLRYGRVGFTSLLLLLLAPVGVVLSVAVLYLSFKQGNTVPQWAIVLCPVPMLLMPVLARSIALAKQPLQ